MVLNSEKIARDFLELASEQRMSILINLNEKKLNIAKLAEILDSTRPEIHRNVNRLVKGGIIEKQSDGNYALTIFGQSILIQIPLLSFISDNKQYFSNHTFGNMEHKFIQRLGVLNGVKQIKGFVKVLEKWKTIHENADKYIYNILSEVPYSTDIIDTISLQLERGVHIRSIFAEKAAIPESRNTVFQKKDFQKYIVKELLERRIMKDVSIVVLVTDKEGAVIFSNLQNEPDLSIMFTSTDSKFQDWCLDYFEWCWKNSTAFQESKLQS